MKHLKGEVIKQESRSRSLPECNKLHTTIDIIQCDDWFRTWPSETQNTHQSNTSSNNNNSNCDRKISLYGDTAMPVNNSVTLSEALQNISLAYSPVTKQLHIVDSGPTSTDVVQDSNHDNIKEKSKGHKRNEPGSFSSTISTLSDPSTSGSLLESDERSLADSDEESAKRKGLSNFFSKKVAVWKSGGSSVWNLFGKQTTDRETSAGGSPLHVVASSTALIQHQRPSSLPAKTMEEETRHREEYKAMILAARKKDAQHSVARLKQQKQQLEQEEQQAHAAKHFLRHVLPNWEQMRTDKKTRDMWWRGLPSSIRGRVWCLAIGNSLNITSESYKRCHHMAQRRLKESSLNKSDCQENNEIDLIGLDIARTFPQLGIFQHGGPYWESLHLLLATYACYRPDVGYVQGMSYIAAVLILNMDVSDAFVAFANLLDGPLHRAAFTLDQRQLQAYYDAYDEVFAHNMPKLHGHFQRANLTPDLYLLDWIYTVFAKAMPLDVASRVWDVFLRDGHEFIFRTALGILRLNEQELAELDFLHGAQFLTRLPDGLSSERLFKSIRGVSTGVGKLTFQQIVAKYLGTGGET